MSELIDRQAFIENERKLYCEDCDRRKGTKNGKPNVICYEIGEAPCRACWLDDALTDLEDFPTASPWHRVEEELPNFSGKVLVNIKPVVSCDSDRFETAYYNCLMSGDIDPKTFWQYDYEKDCIVDITKYVTHWMAVEPPKEDA